MDISKPVILLSGPEDDQPSEPAMKFRLTYGGLLRPTGGDPRNNQSNPLANHKHGIRKEFHKQLRELWRTNKFLRDHTVYKNDWPTQHPAAEFWSTLGPDESDKISLREAVASQYHEFGYRFVPLVQERFSLLCSLDILFLRRDSPGSIVSAGDIDNRIKTLIDCLRRPRNQAELVGDDATPNADEDPFYCLLEDDKQVSRLSVETDTLLEPRTNDDADHGTASLVITVELRPYYVTMFNLSFS